MAEDFTSPGNDGGDIPSDRYDKDKPATHIQHEHGPLPAVLECGKRYSLSMQWEDGEFSKDKRPSARQNMYRDALDFLKARAEKLTCPQSCQPMHTWVARRGWDTRLPKCVTVYVTLGISCPARGDEKPHGLKPPDDDAFEKNIYDAADDTVDDPGRPIQGHEDWTLSRSGPYFRCGKDVLIKATYLAAVETCTDPKFADKVATARKLAQFYVDQVVCLTKSIYNDEGELLGRLECKKRAKRLRTEWDCKWNQVEVHVYWFVNCDTQP